MYVSPLVSVFATDSPFGLKATSIRFWPAGSGRLATNLPAATFHKMTLPSVSAASRKRPFGLKAMSE